jgi:hypothetical protein
MRATVQPQPITRANPYAIASQDHDAAGGGQRHAEVIHVGYHTPWSTRVFARFARGVTCLLLIAVVTGIIGGVLMVNRHSPPPAWLAAGLLIAPWPLAIMLFVAMSRRSPTRLALRDDLIQVGVGLLRREVQYEDIRLLKIERPPKTVGRQSLLTLQAAAGAPMKIWLKSGEALECFEALRGLCAHAPAIGLDGETFEPLDPAHAHRGRSTLAAEHRRKAAWAMAAAVLLGSFALLHVAAMLLGWGAGNGRSPPVTRTIILSGVALGALMSSLEQRRRARAIETEPRPFTTFSHS